jgi:predicted deacetylase
MKKSLEILLAIILILLIVIIFLRLILPREIDDVSPGIKCEQKYLEKADTFWVIPNYREKPISENKLWCYETLQMNKTLGMHGVDHYYREFQDNKISQKRIITSMEIFKECFGYKPTIFKAPYLMLSKENKETLEKNHFKIKGQLNQIIHKVYHCSDTGTLPNYLHDLF